MWYRFFSSSSLLKITLSSSSLRFRSIRRINGLFIAVMSTIEDTGLKMVSPGNWGENSIHRILLIKEKHFYRSSLSRPVRMLLLVSECRLIWPSISIRLKLGNLIQRWEISLPQRSLRPIVTASSDSCPDVNITSFVFSWKVKFWKKKKKTSLFEPTSSHSEQLQ